MSDSFEGKKVFFLFPHSVIQSELISRILENEYEVYLLDDAVRARRLVKRFPGSILFANIDEEMDDEGWQLYIREILADAEETVVGILTYNENTDLAQKYLMEIGVSGGFIRLKLGFEQSADIILKTLAANEAHGRRKYIRVRTTAQNPVVFNVSFSGRMLAGSVIDISSIGMAIAFDNNNIEIQKNTLLSGIQLKLKGKLTLCDGVVFGSRQAENGRIIYVILFTQKKAPDTKKKIHDYIYNTLQASLKSL